MGSSENWPVFVVRGDSVVSMSIDVDSMESTTLGVSATDGSLDSVLDAIRGQMAPKHTAYGAKPSVAEHVLILLSQPIRDQKFTMAVNGMEASALTASLIGGLMGSDVELFNVDDAVAMNAWEDYGAALQPIDQLKWARRSRLSLFTTHHDHVGRSMVDSGKVVDGLHYDANAWPWAWLTSDRLEKDGDRRYFAWNLDRTSETVLENDAADEVFWATSVDSLDSDSLDLKSCQKVNRKWLEAAAHGAVMLSMKRSCGWKAWFLADADARDRESDELVELSLSKDLDDIINEEKSETGASESARENQDSPSQGTVADSEDIVDSDEDEPIISIVD